MKTKEIFAIIKFKEYYCGRFHFDGKFSFYDETPIGKRFKKFDAKRGDKFKLTLEKIE